MGVSLSLFLLLQALSFSPLTIALFCSATVSLFFYEVLGIVDPKDTLSVDIARGGGENSAKISLRFIGASALFLAVWVGVTLFLQKEKSASLSAKTELQTLANKKQGSDDKYILIVKPKEQILDPANRNIVAEQIFNLFNHDTIVGRLDVSTGLGQVYDTDQFNPILVTIRNQCFRGQGLCKTPNGWFPIKLVGRNDSLKGNRVSVCEGHDYMAGKLLNFSRVANPPDPGWDISDIGKTGGINHALLTSITVQTPIEVSRDIDPHCPQSNSAGPRFRVSGQMKEPLQRLLGKDPNLFARIL
jgi:hypothetical protein